MIDPYLIGILPAYGIFIIGMFAPDLNILAIGVATGIPGQQTVFAYLDRPTCQAITGISRYFRCGIEQPAAPTPSERPERGPLALVLDNYQFKITSLLSQVYPVGTEAARA